MMAGGWWQEVMGGMACPSLALSVCPLCVPSPPRSYSKQRATIDREYGQVRRFRISVPGRPRPRPACVGHELGMAPCRQWAASEIIRAWLLLLAPEGGGRPLMMPGGP